MDYCPLIINDMAHRQFSTIINAVESKLFSIQRNIDDYSRYFNNWTFRNGHSSDKVFRRNTLLNLRNIFWLIVSRIVRSLPVALDEFFSRMDLPVPTKSAFSMKRKLIRSDFFELMSNTVVEEFYRSPRVLKWHGFVLMACDGTRLALPDVDELGSCFGWYHTYQGKNLYPCAKACVFHDTLNNISVCASVEKKDTDDRISFESHFRQASELTGSRTIMLLDRGYFSYHMMYVMSKENQKFVMKARNAPWGTDFIHSGLRQSTVRIRPSKATSIYKNQDWLAEPEKELVVRLVRFDHPDGSTDVLITNLTAAEGVSYNDVISLYRLRWGVETAYGIYKNDEALELFSSFRADGVLQDFHAAVIMYNLASILSADAMQDSRRRIKPDMNVVIGLIHNLCPVLAMGPDRAEYRKRIRYIVEEAGHCYIYINPGRSFPRTRRKRKTSGKFYRHTNFSRAV